MAKYFIEVDPVTNEVTNWITADDDTPDDMSSMGWVKVSAFPTNYEQERREYSNGVFSLFSWSADERAQDRRDYRKTVFETTLDKMNPVWYDSLTETQKTELATWRQAWLDYPATGTKPDDLDLFEEQ